MIIYHDTFANTNHCPEQLGFDFTQIDSNNGSGESCEGDGHNLLAHVRDYIRRGWHVFPLAPRTKEPVEGWPWTSGCVNDDRADFVFSGTENGIGIGLGELSNGLIDIDLDWAEARDIADVLLSDLPAFGREGTPRSHRLAICTEASRMVKFRLPSVMENDPRLPDAHALCVAELRGSGGYTMFPGSTHPNGEQITWDAAAPGIIPETDLDDLHRHVGLIAFLAVVVRFYPAKGRRDEFCMALTGTLLRSLESWKADSLTETVDDLVKLVARLAHDEEHRTRGKSRDTCKKIQAGEPATGFPTLIEILGLPEKFGETIQEWISLGPEGDERRPVIHVGSADLETQLNRAEAALSELGVSVFQRGKKLVRVIRQDYRVDQSARIEGQSGSLLIEDIEPYWLAEQLHKAASFVRTTGKKTNPTKVTHEFCNHLIVGRRGNWKWPVLKGIIEAPTLRPDWTVLQDHGYDAATGLLLDFGETVFGRIPDNPTRQDAEEALNRFIEIVRGFPFAPDAIPDDWSPTEDQGKLPSCSRSVVLSAWLTGLIRRSLRRLRPIDNPDMDGVIKRYTEATERWATVTPIVLPGHLNGRGLERRQTKLVVKSLVHAGILTPITEIHLQADPIFPGAERAGRYRVPEYLRQFTKTHAIITFSEPIVGPVVIGAGRYVGLGLMAGLTNFGRT